MDLKKREKVFELKTDESSYLGKTVIYATGTKWKKLGVPGEEAFTNKGVHYCALCDGAFYKDKVVAVVGGGDSAAKEALLLTQWASKVYIIYRGEEIHPEPINYGRVKKNKKIEIIRKANIIEIKGDQKVSRVVLDREYKNNKELKLDAVFVEIGHSALSELAQKVGVKVNKKGEIIIDRLARTNVEGFYAAGDVADLEFKQAITGVGEAVAASYSAYKYLTGEEL